MHIAATQAVLLIALGAFSGLIGALVGIGGGIIVVPALVLGFGCGIKVAVATSLVTVVATSTTAGSVWVGKGLANMRLGMTLEVATTLGGLSGGLLAALISPSILAGLFGVLMGVTAALMMRKPATTAAASNLAPRDQTPRAMNDAPARGATEPDGTEEPGTLAGSYVDGEKRALVSYRVERIWLGSVISFAAGILSGMLGVGGGFIKVPAMHLGMRVPIKVAAATSNFMIGVTAISSLFVYLARGLVHPALAAPVALGTLAGSLVGTRVARHVSATTLKRLLAAVLVLVAMQMMLQSAGVTLGH